MEERDIRNWVSELAKESGLKIRSIYRKPLTNDWYIGLLKSQSVIRFSPKSSATDEECIAELRRLLCPASFPPIVEDEIDNLRLRQPDNIYAAMQQLKAIGESAVGPLIKAAQNQSDSRTFRLRVIGTLGMIADPGAVGPLIELLTDNDVQIRWHAVKALGEIGDKQAIVPLEHLATDDSDGFSIPPNLYVTIREAAQEAIRKINTKQKAEI